MFEYAFRLHGTTPSMRDVADTACGVLNQTSGSTVTSEVGSQGGGTEDALPFIGQLHAGGSISCSLSGTGDRPRKSADCRMEFSSLIARQGECYG